MNIPPFTLYGLNGCPHCEQAYKFLQSRNLPTQVVEGSADPIAEEGVRWAVTEKYKANPPSEEKLAQWRKQGWKDGDPYLTEFPTLVYKPNKSVVLGFQQSEYERLAMAYYALNGASAPNVFIGGQPNQPVQA
jgi:glutaredoxin